MQIKLSLLLNGLLLFFLFSCSPSTEELYVKAEKLQEKKQYAKAIEVYDKILNRNFKLQDAFFEKGYCYLQDSNYVQALHFFDVVKRLKGLTNGSNIIFEMNPDSPFAQEEDRHQIPIKKLYYQIAVTQYYMGNLSDSYNNFWQARNKNYKTANCLAWQGLILARLDSIDKACIFFSKARELGETDVDRLLKQYCQKSENK